jgi:DnaJ-domain-containing protein 1
MQLSRLEKTPLLQTSSIHRVANSRAPVFCKPINTITMSKKGKGFMDGYDRYDTSEGFGSQEEWQNVFSHILGQSKNLSAEYAILGVSPGATADQLKKARNRLIKQWHPDLNSHQPDLAERMAQKINDAYTEITKHGGTAR